MTEPSCTAVQYTAGSGNDVRAMYSGAAEYMAECGDDVRAMYSGAAEYMAGSAMTSEPCTAGWPSTR
ncbi:MAG: hypothetical protein SPI19_06280, partial [Peptoniphilaceae bacterium]|nr:hypothetical protein [Peptoniphilaceae bacterium]